MAEDKYEGVVGHGWIAYLTVSMLMVATAGIVGGVGGFAAATAASASGILVGFALAMVGVKYLVKEGTVVLRPGVPEKEVGAGKSEQEGP